MFRALTQSERGSSRNLSELDPVEQERPQACIQFVQIDDFIPRSTSNEFIFTMRQVLLEIAHIARETVVVIPFQETSDGFLGWDAKSSILDFLDLLLD